MTNKLNELSATKIAEGIRNKKFSAREVMQAHLQKIVSVNDKLNAIVQVLDPEIALAQADEADRKIANNEQVGPLHGVPVTIKDHISVKDFIVTRGIPGLKTHRCDFDAAIVDRLKQAGAIIIGITNMPELGPAFESDNDVYGCTNNPYDLTKTPGGSSGGEAAIISSAGSALGIGSDGGGSIRVPAHFCGIAGIKPTQHLLPCTGNVPADGGLGMLFYTPGPMARYVEDLKLTLPLIAGPDNLDPHVAPVNLAACDKRISDLRVAYVADNDLVSPDQDTQKTLENSMAALQAEKAHIDVLNDFKLGEMGNCLWETYFYGGDGGQSYHDLLKHLNSPKPSATLQRFFDDAEKAERFDVTTFKKRLFDMDQYRMQALTKMVDYDVLICPTCATPAKDHGSTQSMINDFYTMAFNLLKWPVTVVRCGTSSTGLPIGLQIAAKPWKDMTSLAVAGFLETALGGWQLPNIVG